MSTVEITNIEYDKDNLSFIISGDNEYGLDKSIVNGIRRVLLNDIPTVAFETDDNKNNDLTMVTNNTSLHNEMMLHRISLIPLFINPNKFMKTYLFDCNIKFNSDNPFQFVTTNDINIYPLKEHILERINDLHDESKTSDKDKELSLISDLLKNNNPENYQLENPLSQKKKDEIFKPFEFRGNKNHSLIIELKNTNSENINQEIHFYGSPSVKTGTEHSRYQSVSCANYTFVKNEPLIQEILKEKIKINSIDSSNQEEVQDFTDKFMLSESERYFLRDNFNEPNSYEFKIKSLHYFNSTQLFIKAIQILIEKCELLKLSFLHMLQEKDSLISSEQKDDFTFHYLINNYCHTIGNLIQTHIVRRTLHDKCILQLFGYKKNHPLEDRITFYCSLHPKHKVCKMNETQKYQQITSFIMEQIDEVTNELKSILKTAEEAFK
jgi:DNA-directed RNA polymerase subunit L